MISVFFFPSNPDVSFSVFNLSGASALHFAIAYENNKLVKKLIEVNCNVLQRANGKFFMPIDQQWPLPRPKTNFEGNTQKHTLTILSSFLFFLSLF